MPGRIHAALWGTDAGRARSLAHPVRGGIFFGTWIFVWMWLIQSRQADAGYLIADAIGSVVGAILFVLLMNAGIRRRLQRGRS